MRDEEFIRLVLPRSLIRQENGNPNSSNYVLIDSPVLSFFGAEEREREKERCRGRVKK